MKQNLIEKAALIAVILPLLNFFIVNLLKNRFKKESVLYVCCGFIATSAIAFNFASYHFYQHINYGFASPDRMKLVLWEWLNVADLIVANFAIKLDMLSIVMGIVVLNISALVHIYSVGYMHDDEQQEKFMSYLSLFTFFMLILIFSDNMLQLFVGWEGVGVCSYLLIGFWYHKPSANKAAMKAFIVNRVADIGLIFGIGLMIFTFRSVEFAKVLNQGSISQLVGKEILGINIIDLICFSLFIGCMGKSAQIFLHVWLPDAMEGPTPVSALIHAATMVTAGVFLLARCSILFEYSQTTLDFITVVGAVTAVFAATIAVAQNDIKKIIAYSTCSQLGYMFFACGVSAYQQAVFHLFTHAFFKALLFLGAGSVIHGIHGEQDIKKMGGLRKYMPMTYLMMGVGSLAIAGIFPFAGFFSKDAILENAHLAGTAVGNFAYYCGLIAAFLTAFYSWRLIILVFNREKPAYEHEPHESPMVMLLPLLVLAAGAIFSGLIGEALDMNSLEFWHGSIFSMPRNQDAHNGVSIDYTPMILALIAIAAAYLIYLRKTKLASSIQSNFIKRVLLNGYYIDCIYDFIFVRATYLLSKTSAKYIEQYGILSLPQLISRKVLYLSRFVKSLHTGDVQDYLVASITFTCYFGLKEYMHMKTWLIVSLLFPVYIIAARIVSMIKTR